MSHTIRHFLTNGATATYANYLIWRNNNNGQDTGILPSVKTVMDEQKIPSIYEKDLTNNPFKDVVVLDNSGSMADATEGSTDGEPKWKAVKTTALLLLAGLSPTKSDGLVHFEKLNPTDVDRNEGAGEGISIPNTENGRAVLSHFMDQKPSGRTPMEIRTRQILEKHRNDPEASERAIHIRHITDGVNDATSTIPPGMSTMMAGITEYASYISENVINNPAAIEKTAITHYLIVGEGEESEKINKAYTVLDEKKSPVILDGKTVHPKIDTIRSQTQEMRKAPLLKNIGIYRFRLLEGASNPKAEVVGEEGAKDTTVKFGGAEVIRTTDIQASIQQTPGGCCIVT